MQADALVTCISEKEGEGGFRLNRFRELPRELVFSGRQHLPCIVLSVLSDQLGVLSQTVKGCVLLAAS